MKTIHAGGSSMAGQSEGTAGPQEKKRRVGSDDSTTCWCHQCHNKSNREEALRCRTCKKFYCVRCARKWYPTMDAESFREFCPLCHNICNCGDCLQSVKIKDLGVPENVFHFSTYIIQALLPSLKKFNDQCPDNEVTELLDRAHNVLPLPVEEYGVPVFKGPWLCSCPENGGSSQTTLKASSREPGDDNYLYYPPGSEINFNEMAHFQWHFSRGQPVIVQNVRSRTFEFSWDPKVLDRALELYRKTSKNCLDVMVMNCSSWREEKSTMRGFLKGYSNAKNILNLEEWPLANDFQELLPRHYADALRCLPMRNYTHPAGCVNEPAKLRPVDVGPKISVHYGPRRADQRSNSISRLKYTFPDRVYILMHTGEYILQEPESTEAVTRWDVFRKQDIPKLEAYLRKYDQELLSVHPHHGIFNPIIGKYFLTMSQKLRLKEELGIEPWTFDQKLGEAVIIPAGCIYQSEKLKPCVQLAFDFISPEFLAKSELVEELRSFGLNSPLRFNDLAKELIIHAIKTAVEGLESIE